MKIIHSRATTAFLAIAVIFQINFAGDDPSNFSPEDFGGPIWALDAPYMAAVVDVQNLAGYNHSVWAKPANSNCGDAYFGEEFVRYKGPNLAGVHPDVSHTRQGDKDSWLVMKFYIPPGQGGYYRMAVQKCHVLHDGDNDCWVGYIGMPKSVVIGRYGWGTQGQWSWGGLQTHTPPYIYSMEAHPDGFMLDEGVNAVYVAGRSIGFEISRIAVYKADPGISGYVTRGISPHAQEWNKTNNVEADSPRSLSTKLQVQANTYSGDFYTLTGKKISKDKISTIKNIGTRQLMISPESKQVLFLTK